PRSEPEGGFGAQLGCVDDDIEAGPANLVHSAVRKIAPTQVALERRCAAGKAREPRRFDASRARSSRPPKGSAIEVRPARRQYRPVPCPGPVVARTDSGAARRARNGVVSLAASLSDARVVSLT